MYQAANTKSTLKIKPHSWQVIQAGKSSCSWGPHWGPREQLLMGTPLGPLRNCSKGRTVSYTQMFLKLSKRCWQHTQCVCRHNENIVDAMPALYAFALQQQVPVSDTFCWHSQHCSTGVVCLHTCIKLCENTCVSY